MAPWGSFWRPILADRSHWERLGDGFKEKIANPIDGADLLVCAGIVGVVALLVLVLQGIVRRQAIPRRYCKRGQMFHELCAAHRLPMHDRRLLRLLATDSHLEQPAEVFLRPDLFAEATISPGLSNHLAEIGNLRIRLFGRSIESMET